MSQVSSTILFPHSFPQSRAEVTRILQIDRDTLRVAYGWDAGMAISQEMLLPVLREQIKPHPKRRIETRQAAAEWLTQLGESVDAIPQVSAGISNAAPQSRIIPASRNLALVAEREVEKTPAFNPAKTTRAPISHPTQGAGGIIQSRIRAMPLEFAALITALVFQTKHSFYVAWEISQPTNEHLRIASSVFGAVAIDAAAIVLTMHAHQKKNWMLRAFAVFQFLINLLYYSPWMKFYEKQVNNDPAFLQFNAATNWNYAVMAFLMSAAIAFVVFIYSEIFVGDRKS